MVMGDDSCFIGRGFKSRHQNCMDFFILICCKNCIVCLKRPKINEKRPKLAHFFNYDSSFLLTNNWFYDSRAVK